MRVPGDLLDLILIGLAAAFAVAGYRQGFIIGVLSFVGFLGGAALGAVISPHIATALAKSMTAQALVAIVVVFVTAMLGQLLASLAGSELRSQVRWEPAAFVDAIGGAVVSVISVLLIAWLIGSAVANAPFQGIASQVRRSAVLRGVNQFMPQSADTMFSDFRRLVGRSPYVQVFGAFGGGSALSVPPPSASVVHSAGLARAANSIVKVVGTAPGCRPPRRIEGSGFVYATDHVITNAHVVAGVTDGPTVTTRGGASFRATVVLYDPERDVAVLYVPGLRERSLRFSYTAGYGADAIVAGYPLNSGFTPVPARIGDEQVATGQDIYQSRMVSRDIYRLRAKVQSGNSGGPLLSPGGRVYGVVFAAAVGEPDLGYALTAREIAPDAQRGAGATAAVSTQACD